MAIKETKEAPVRLEAFDEEVGHVTLRASHYAACYLEGMTEEEIEADWEQVEIDLLDQMRGL